MTEAVEFQAAIEEEPQKEEKKIDRSTKDMSEILSYFKRGMTIKEVKQKMNDFVGWSEKSDDYRERTLQKAIEYFDGEVNQEKDPISYENVADALEKGIPEINYVLEPFIREGGLTIIAGEPASRKSLFAQIMSMCIVKGAPLFEKYKSQKKKVLWIDYENGSIVMLNRFKSLLNGNFQADMEDLNNLYFSISPNFKFDEPKDMKLIINAIEATSADVIIVDPFISAIRGDENKSQDVRKLFDNIRPLMEKGKSFIIIHHIGKEAQKRGLNALRGSSDLGGMAEIVLLLTKKNDFTNVRLEKHRHQGTECIDPFAFLIEKQTIDQFLPIKFFEKTPDQEDAISQCKNDLIEWLNDNYESGDSIKSEKILAEMDKFNNHKKNTVYSALKLLENEKILKKGGKKGYREVL